MVMLKGCLREPTVYWSTLDLGEGEGLMVISKRAKK